MGTSTGLHPRQMSSEWNKFLQEVAMKSVPYLGRLVAQVNMCGICDGQSGTGTGFAPGLSAFTCQYHSTAAPDSLIYLRLEIGTDTL
jgi:hypothetical protein